MLYFLFNLGTGIIVGYLTLYILEIIFLIIDVKLSIIKYTKNHQITFSENGLTVNLYSEITIQNLHKKQIIKNCKVTILHKVNGIPLCESVVKFPYIPPQVEISIPFLESVWKHIAVAGMENYTTEILKIKYDHYHNKEVEKVLKDFRAKNETK